MGGMTLKQLFALAPVDATHINKHNGKYHDMARSLTTSNMFNYIEIPPRERELNRLADDNELWLTDEGAFAVGVGGKWESFNLSEIKVRRTLRLEAGLIESPPTCKGANCTASESNGYTHSEECLAEYHEAIGPALVEQKCEKCNGTGWRQEGYREGAVGSYAVACECQDVDLTAVLEAEASEQESVEAEPAKETYRYIIENDAAGKPPIYGQTYLNFPSLTTEQQNQVEDYALSLVGGQPELMPRID